MWGCCGGLCWVVVVGGVGLCGEVGGEGVSWGLFLSFFLAGVVLMVLV